MSKTALTLFSGMVKIETIKNRLRVKIDDHLLQRIGWLPKNRKAYNNHGFSTEVVDRPSRPSFKLVRWVGDIQDRPSGVNTIYPQKDEDYCILQPSSKRVGLFKMLPHGVWVEADFMSSGADIIIPFPKGLRCLNTNRELWREPEPEEPKQVATLNATPGARERAERISAHMKIIRAHAKGLTDVDVLTLAMELDKVGSR